MAKPRKKKKNVKRKKVEEIELHPDAWERFEKGLKQITQTKEHSTGRHRSDKGCKPKS